jgi:hypothetical protein
MEFCLPHERAAKEHRPWGSGEARMVSILAQLQNDVLAYRNNDIIIKIFETVIV